MKTSILLQCTAVAPLGSMSRLTFTIHLYINMNCCCHFLKEDNSLIKHSLYRISSGF